MERLYAELGSVTALSEHLGLSQYHARKRLAELGIPTGRAKKSRQPRRAKGPAHHNWKGGTYICTGYVFEYAPWHPAAVAHKGYVHQHRLVAEATIGRYLQPDEIVHHINGDKLDNRPENVTVTTRSAHGRLHKQIAPRDSAGRFV